MDDENDLIIKNAIRLLSTKELTSELIAQQVIISNNLVDEFLEKIISLYIANTTGLSLLYSFMKITNDKYRIDNILKSKNISIKYYSSGVFYLNNCRRILIDVYYKGNFLMQYYSKNTKEMKLIKDYIKTQNR